MATEQELEHRAVTEAYQEEVEVLRSRIAELESEKTARTGRVTAQRTEGIKYRFPVPTPEQAKRTVVGGNPITRVVKITYADLDKRFTKTYENGEEVFVVNLGQYRVPLADGGFFDVDRLFMEMRKFGLVLPEEVFDDAPHYCETSECWKPARELGKDENGRTRWDSFCSNSHRTATLEAHDRRIRFQ